MRGMRSVGKVIAILLLVGASCSGDSDPESSAPEASEAAALSPSPSVVEVDPSVVATLDDFAKEADEVIPVDGFGDFLHVSAGHLWIGNPGTETVDRIDLETNEIVGSTPGPVSCTGIDSGFGSVWVPSCKEATVYRIDEKTAKVTAKIKVEQVIEETTVGVGEGGVWLITGDGLLSRIDPKTNKVAETLQVEPVSAGVKVGFGSVWVTSNRENVIQRIDPERGRAVATIPLGGGPRFLSIGEDAVWVANQTVGTLSRIDPEIDEVVAEIDIGPIFSGGDVAAGDGVVWAATGRGPLSVIDQATNSVIQQWDAHGADGVALDGPTTWISDHDLQTIYRFTLDR
jgi:virginiamycin B lyase